LKEVWVNPELWDLFALGLFGRNGEENPKNDF
jgi:hypothetical protein